MRWGILGAGNIVRRIAPSFGIANAQIYAIASKDLQRANMAAKAYGAQKAYGSYLECVQDPSVQIVYVATAHADHMDCTLLALEHGKPVLCEKPFALNHQQAKRMEDCAKANHVFLMEAMWTAHFPAMAQVKQWINSGKIGQVTRVTADFGCQVTAPSDHWIYQKQKGGGCLLDLGVYPVWFASHILGQPQTILAKGSRHKSGVVDDCSILLGYDNGQTAQLSCSIESESAHLAQVFGTKGRIDIPQFWRPTQLTLVDHGNKKITKRFATQTEEGFSYELCHVQDCIARGLTQSPVLPLSQILDNMKTMDTIASLLEDAPMHQ